MSERQNNTSEIGATPESNQDILAKQSVSVQKIIEKDPILSKNLDQITNPKEFFEKLAQNAYIFEQTDNLSVQKTFLEQSLKGLEYGQYTQDGREFAKLSDEEVGKLNDADVENYLAWLEKMEIEQKQKTIKIQERRQDVQAKNQMELKGLQQDEAKNQEIVGKRQDVQAEIIELKEKNTKAGEENQKIIDTLSPNGKSFLDTEFQKARNDEKNPIYQDLISKGIDPSKGEFDNILRASIILANAETLSKESNNEQVFEQSIRELGKLGIPYPVKKDIPSISSHIDARFPKGISTESAKGEITRSIEGGNVANIYYDGKGEKYTLIGKDGKTSKEIYMNPPPRMEIIKNGLRIGRDIEPVSPEEKQRKEAEKNLADKTGAREKAENAYFETDKYRKTNNELSKNPDIAQSIDEKNTLSKEYSEAKDTKTKKEIITKILEKASGIEKDWRANIGFEDTLESANSSFREIERSIEMEKMELNTLNKSLSDELQAEQELPPEPTTKKLDTGFESAADYNLNFLSYIGYDGLGQDGLERIIERLNSPSNPRRSKLGEIRLGDKLDRPQTQALTLAIANLVRGGRQSGVPPTQEQAKQEKEQKTWDGVDKTDPIIAARQTQSFGFRDSLLSVRRNMTQEGGTLKTRGQLDKALFGIESLPEKNDSAENTATPAESMTRFA